MTSASSLSFFWKSFPILIKFMIGGTRCHIFNNFQNDFSI
jgi:hypothetical protein